MIAVSSNGSLLLISQGTHTYVYNIYTLELIKIIDEASVSICVTQDGSKFAYCTEKKILNVGNIDSTELTLELPKKPSKMVFIRNTEIVIADKFGDLTLYSIEKDNSKIEGKLLLGHVSILTDFVFSNDGFKIITCDKDEKIRISRFPESYEIEGFCLGHTSFVKSVCCLSCNPNRLLSGGKDLNIMLWSLDSFNLLSSYFVKDVDGVTSKSFVQSIINFVDDYFLVSFFNLPLLVIIKYFNDEIYFVNSLKLDLIPMAFSYKVDTKQVLYLAGDFSSKSASVWIFQQSSKEGEYVVKELIEASKFDQLADPAIEAYLAAEDELYKANEDDYESESKRQRINY